MGLLLAEVICLSAFYIEIRRAIGGNNLSWAYVFEWPIFAGYAVYVWKKLLSDERAPSPDRAPDDHIAHPDEPDAALERYNDYLRGVHGERDDADQPPPPSQCTPS